MTRRSRIVQPRFRPLRRLQLMTVTRDDPFEAKCKPRAPSVCADCGVLWSGSRWHWGEPPAGAERVQCPACRRAHEHAPAGYVRLSGPSVAQHRADLVGLIRNHEQHERAEHPLQRLMSMADEDGALLLTTTDIHLARGIGTAVRAAHGGRLRYRYNKAEHLLYVTWRG